MFGFVSLGVSFASLVISCAALYWSRMARIEAAGAVERSRYALESSRKHVGLPYDHKIVHDWELRTQFGFAKSRTGKAVMVFGFPMSLEEMDTVRAEFESQLAYQSRIMREDRMMRF